MLTLLRDIQEALTPQATEAVSRFLQPADADTDAPLRRYFEGESRELPAFYTEQVRRDLGSWWRHLPEEALHHDQNAYLVAREPATASAPMAVRHAPRSGPAPLGWTPRPAGAAD